MPELPDLEVFSQHLTRKLAGKKLTDIRMPLKGIDSNVSIQKLKKLMKGAVLRKITREGKELFFHFSNKHVLGYHLMLHGRFYWLDEEEEKKNTLLVLSFSNKKALALTDFQRQAKLTLDPPAKKAPDALAKEVNIAFWKEKLQSKARIKNLLLDQNVLRGIGNAYADEILWASGISPFSIANKIPEKQVKALAKTVPSVLKRAVVQIRKASKDVIGGEIRDFLQIHNSSKEKSPTGGIIRTEKKGRITYYTDEQALFT